MSAAALALAVGLGVGASAVSGPSGGKQAMRVGQANIAGWAMYGGSTEAGADLANAVLDADLHVVGVAETCEQQLEEAERLLSGHGPVQAVFRRTVPRDHSLPWGAASDDECVYGIGLVARGAVTLTDVTTSELPTLDGQPGGFDREEDRHVLCARTSSDDQRLDDVLVCTTHFTRWEVAEGRRRSQAEHLAARLSALASDRTAVLVLADLNARRGHADIEPLYAWGLDDVGSGDSRDHVMTRCMEGGRARPAPLGRSDHDMLVASVVRDLR